MEKTSMVLKIIFVLLLFAAAGTIMAQKNTKEIKDFKPSGKVWGYVFGDYYYKVHADSLNRGNTQYSNIAKDKNFFEFR